MKKIVNGKIYDTEKSELVYTEQDTQRKLYRTQKGAWFRCYKNGEVVPIDEETAMEYLGRVDVDKYIEYFGNVDEA